MQSDTAMRNYSGCPNLQAIVRRSHPAQPGEGSDAPPTLKRSGYIPCPLRGKGLGESGGALFKGKEGRGDFRKTSFERRPVQSDTAMRNKI